MARSCLCFAISTKAGSLSSSVSGATISRASCVTAAVLIKLARHLALVASLTILSEAAGRIAVSQLAIFIVIVLAALSHTIGHTLQLALRKQTALTKGVP
jgi:hypothetical protein